GACFGVNAPGSSHRTSSRTLGEVFKGEIAPNESQQWQGTAGETIRIPPVPPMLYNCQIIQIQYLLKFTVVPSGPSFSLDVDLPLTIGTIPLREHSAS